MRRDDTAASEEDEREKAQLRQAEAAREAEARKERKRRANERKAAQKAAAVKARDAQKSAAAAAAAAPEPKEEVSAPRSLHPCLHPCVALMIVHACPEPPNPGRRCVRTHILLISAQLHPLWHIGQNFGSHPELKRVLRMRRCGVQLKLLMQAYLSAHVSAAGLTNVCFQYAGGGGRAGVRRGRCGDSERQRGCPASCKGGGCREACQQGAS